MADLDHDEESALELPTLWQFIHPEYAREGSEEGGGDLDEEDEEDEELRQRRLAPKLSKVLRFLNDVEDDEELERLLQERDPVTRQTLLQWAARQRHFILVEYLIKRAQRMAFGFPTESTEMTVFLRWEEMKAELPSAAEVQARQQRRDERRAERMAARLQQMLNPPDEEEEEPEEEDDDEDEAEPLPEEMVHESLAEYHDDWGERGVGIVKQIGELGVYVGARLRDGVKQGIGMALYPNGDAYAGEYVDNMRHGEGVYWWSQQGTLYVGTWARGVRHGASGRIVYPDGSRYLGSWYGDAKYGKGRYLYANGSSYDGEWVHNQKQGFGVYRHTDGSLFHGSFVNNEFTAGEWRLASGTTRYIGNFVKDVPEGAGIFLHRLGIGMGSESGGVAPTLFRPLGAFQQEGRYGKGGKWHPGTLHGTTRVPPRLDILAPRNPDEASKRIPLTFAKECAGGVMADLVKAANFPPLCRWLQRILSLHEDDTNGAVVKNIEVCSFVYSREDNAGLIELRVRPVLFNANGERIRLSTTSDETILLKERTTRLLVIIERVGRNTEEIRAPMVVLERRLHMSSDDPSHMQHRLPIVQFSHDGVIEGEFARNVCPALRISLSRGTTKQLLRPLQSDPLIGDAEEEVLMYVQQWSRDAHRMLEGKVRVASAAHTLPEEINNSAAVNGKAKESETENAETTEEPTAENTGFVACEYVAIPLASVPSVSTDAITVIAAATALRRRRVSQLPAATVSPQRPPTPIPPQPEPRPELQPLYDAREAMKIAEEEERDSDTG